MPLQSAAGVPMADPADRRWHWQISMPAWLASLVLHALLVILLGYVAGQQLHGTGAPHEAVLIASYASDVAQEDYYDDEQAAEVVGEAEPNPSDADDAGQSDMQAAQSGLAAIADGPPPVDVASELPSTELAAANAGEAMAGAATGVGELRAGPRRPAAIHGKWAKTHVYGLPGEGNAFVYVFDRSSSMGIGANSLLASAKRELLASLDDLGEENRFQIIFYNQEPTMMDLGRSFGGMVFADQRVKELARRFVDGISASGSTEHYAAFTKALRLAPDVIFFLTDADEPELHDGKIAQLRNLNGGRTTINTIEFGEGPQPRRENFLARIARENGGKYVYIDIRRGAWGAAGAQ
ncbi:MAG TPA: hypothetical protein VHC22_20150 [Pirellulales bacterium]|nr:hypothetical protein [Pirellulales bacterium]